MWISGIHATSRRIECAKGFSMKDDEKIKWAFRERERNDLEESWRKEDQWDDEAKRESDRQNYLYEQEWGQEDNWYNKWQRNIENKRYLDDIDFNRQREKSNYRKCEMNALEERWRREDQLEFEAEKKLDYQRFLDEKNRWKW
jgi:hypothetical protein